MPIKKTFHILGLLIFVFSIFYFNFVSALNNGAGSITLSIPANFNSSGSVTISVSGTDTATNQVVPAGTMTLNIKPALPVVTLTGTTNNSTPVNLTWTAVGAQSCAATGGVTGDGWKGTSPSINGGTTSPISVTAPVETFTITCTNSTGSSSAEWSVITTGIAVSLTATPVGPLTEPGATSLSWTTLGNPTSCDATGAAWPQWTGTGISSPKSMTGLTATNSTTSKTYTFGIRCHKAGVTDATDSISVVVNPPNVLTCSPATVNAQVGENLTFGASGGNGTYSWSSDGAIASGSSQAFSTYFTSVGGHSATVTSGGLSSSCSVAVTAPVVTTVGCGSGTRANTTVAPANPGLCAAGYSANSVNLDTVNSQYVWSCGDGVAAHYSNCSAPYTGPVNGQCGSAQQQSGAPSGGLCYIGSASGATPNADGSYSWTCSGANGGSNATCSSQAPVVSTCTTLNVTADDATVLSGSNTTVRWTSNCPQVRISTIYNPGPGYADQTRYLACNDGTYNPAYYNNQCYLNANSNKSLGVGTYTLEGDDVSNNGFGTPIPRISKQVTISDVDFAVKALVAPAYNTNYIALFGGETATFRVNFPLGQCVSTTQYYSDADPVTTTHCNPASFTGSLASKSFTLQNTFSGQEGDAYYDDPRNPAKVYDLGSGAFSPATLTSSNTYTSTFSLKIPANAAPGSYHNTITASVAGGGSRSYPIIFQVIDGTNPVSVNLTATPNPIYTGDSTTLAWTSTGATSCVGTGGDSAWATTKASSGSLVITPASTLDYGISCTGYVAALGTNITKTSTVKVIVKHKPGFIEN